MKTRLMLALLLSAACGTPPEFLPPPFGPAGPSATRFFFPTGLAVLPDGSLLVANGNFNHAYDGGTLVSVRKSYLDQFFAQKLSCEKLTAPEFRLTSTVIPPELASCDDDVSLHNADVFGGVVIIGNYAGPLALNDSSTLAFTGSRDTARLNAVTVNPDLSLQCAPNAGTSSTDCRKGIVDLTASGVVGPFAIVPGDAVVPGSATSQRVLYVSSMTPRLDQVTSGTLSTSGVVAALDMGNPSQVLFTMLDASTYLANGAGVGPMLYDSVRHELFLSGCFQRYSGTGAGEPGTGRCSGIANNYLRILDVDAQASANVQLFDLYFDVLSIETTGMLFADPDPVTQVFGTLWATMRNPDVLVKVELPSLPSVPPRVRKVVPLPISPADLVRIPRAGQPDLIAVIAEKIGALVVYDTGSQQVVAQVPNLGDSPFSLQLLGSDGVTARLAVSVFKGCRVALVEVPLATPWQASLRGRAGVCQ